MTKPRTSTLRHAQGRSATRELFGIIGKVDNVSRIKSDWNRRFKQKGIDAFLDSYPTTAANLPERLSEMFHFDRRGYIVGDNLQEQIVPLLDEINESVAEEEMVDTVINRDGILVGYYLHGDENRRWELWL